MDLYDLGKQIENNLVTLYTSGRKPVITMNECLRTISVNFFNTVLTDETTEQILKESALKIKDLNQTKVDVLKEEKKGLEKLHSIKIKGIDRQLKELTEFICRTGIEKHNEFNSSFIYQIVYNHDSLELTVVMTDTEYTYDNFPVFLFDDFKKAESKGKFYKKHVAGHKYYKQG